MAFELSQRSSSGAQTTTHVPYATVYWFGGYFHGVAATTDLTTMSAIDRLLTIREKIGAQRPDLEFRKPGELRSTEIAWRDRQPWLEEHGYTLRPRYRPDWTPSWKNSRKKWDSVEDEQLASVRCQTLRFL
jgi:hypothetical protein